MEMISFTSTQFVFFFFFFFTSSALHENDGYDIQLCRIGIT